MSTATFLSERVNTCHLLNRHVRKIPLHIASHCGVLTNESYLIWPLQCLSSIVEIRHEEGPRPTSYRVWPWATLHWCDFGTTASMTDTSCFQPRREVNWFWNESQVSLVLTFPHGSRIGEMWTTFLSRHHCSYCVIKDISPFGMEDMP
jgi:hypothetical protein